MFELLEQLEPWQLSRIAEIVAMGALFLGSALALLHILRGK